MLSSTATTPKEVVAGAYEPSAPLYNAVSRFFAFECYLSIGPSTSTKRWWPLAPPAKPTLDTYTLLHCFNKLKVSFVYLHAVRSLDRQKNASSVIPDMSVLNMLIKAYIKCLEVGQALWVFREMGLYGCSPTRTPTAT